MSRRRAQKKRKRGARRGRGAGALRRAARGITRRLASKRTRRRVASALRAGWAAIPDGLQWPLGVAAAAVLIVGANVIYQVARKPTELYFPIEDALQKSHAETWDAYGSLFRRHATPIITADFLAALAQIEASGNPVARTYWRFAWTGDPRSIYRPASSAVGLFQIIDGTFDEAKRYCIHDHRVVEDGPWHDLRSCWFNALYFRVIPSHAIELTAAHLHTHVERALSRHRVRGASLRAKQELATLIHLCGAGAGMAHARRGLRLPSGHRCGAHDARHYVAKMRAAQSRFVRLAAADE